MTTPEQVLLQELDKWMNDYIDRVHQLAQENLIKDGKVDTGKLLTTSNVQRNYLLKVLTFPSNYADVIEWGRNPGSMPPVDALVDWVRRKLGIDNEAEARSVAFAIATAIKQRGMAPSPYLRPAVEQTNRERGVR